MSETSVFVKSFGCSTNLADGEALAGCLKQAGYKLTTNASKADIVVLNTCAVKGPTENRMIHEIKKIPRKKKLIIAGCLPLVNLPRLRNETRFDALAPPETGTQIVEIVTRVMQREESEKNLTERSIALPGLRLPRVRLSFVISLIPVCYGCLGSCSYCCVRNARGTLRSYPINEITERIKQDLASGTKEFWITGQDTACYGLDIDTDLARLLHAISQIDGEFMVRVGMMTPDNAMPILRELVEAFADDRIFKFLHIPVQSGNDQVLTRMNRHYSVRDFKTVTNTFRHSYPTLTLSTDVICGFPGESRKAFEETTGLVEEIKPDIVNVSKFFARPNTAASEMKDEFVPPGEIRRRSGSLANVAKSIALKKNQSWLGWKGQILVDERGKIEGTWIGRNFAYKPVILRSREKILGRYIEARIARSFQTYLQAVKVE